MELRGSETERVVSRALSAELQTTARYHHLAQIARESGLTEVADVLESTARNEAEHARHEFEFLGEGDDIVEGLEQAIRDEHAEAAWYYEEAARVAEKEGFGEVAAFFKGLRAVEGKHEANFRALLDGFGKGAVWEGHTVGYSVVEMAQVMLPGQANPAGFVHGGELMKLADNAAGVVAVRHCRSNIVTARVEDIQFRAPVRVGSLATARGRLVFTSRSSMWTEVNLEMEDLRTGDRSTALMAHFVMVALDGEGRPAAVPPLILATEEEERLFEQARQRYRGRKGVSGQHPDDWPPVDPDRGLA